MGEYRVQELGDDGVWRTSIPLPFYTFKWPFFWREVYSCWQCPSKPKFSTMKEYRYHFVREHIGKVDNPAPVEAPGE